MEHADDSAPHHIPPQKKQSKALALLGIIAIIGAGSILCCFYWYTAIPPLLLAIKKSKASQADRVLRIATRHAAQTYEATCAFPPTLPPTVSAPTDGDKMIVPDATIARWKEVLDVTVPATSFMAYSTERSSTTYVVIARADFETGGDMHTEHVTVTGSNDNGTCTADIGPTLVRFEFE